MRSLIALAAFALGLAGSAVAAPVPSLPQPGTRTFHIELNTLSACYKIGCPSLLADFTGKDFSVLQGSRSYPVHVSRETKSGYRAHLLVVFEPGSPRPRDAALVRRLKEPLSKGWLVSVERRNGTFTPYCDKKTLVRSLTAPVAVLNQNHTVGDIREAANELRSFPGRRVLLLVNTRHGALPGWLREAGEELAPVYVVDGGERVAMDPQASGMAWGGLLSPGPEAQTGGEMSVDSLVTRRAFQNGVMHEVELKSAVKDVVRDSAFDYDLQLSIPASAANRNEPLTLKIERSTFHFVTPYSNQVAAQYGMIGGLYMDLGEEAIGAAASARIAAPQELLIEGLNPDWNIAEFEHPPAHR